MQNFISQKSLLSLTLLACPLFAGSVSVTSTGTAEADPDLYVYNFQISATCFASDVAVEDKVNDLEEKLSQVITPYLAEGIPSEDQYYGVSDLPEQYNDAVSTYVGNTNEQRVICGAGRWYFSSNVTFKLLDASKRKELQKALTKLTSTSNQLNPDYVINKEVFSISVNSVQPSLKPATKKALFEKAFADASSNAKDKVKAILAKEPSAYDSTSFKLIKATENPEDNFGGRNYAFGAEALAMNAGRSASIGVQKLKLSVSYRFDFDVTDFGEQK